MKKNILSFFFLLIGFCMNGQVTFQKVISDTYMSSISSVHLNADGGYVLAGYRKGPVSNYDMYILRTDINGNILWTTGYESGNGDYATHIIQTSDGNFVFSCYSGTIGSYDNAGLVKIDMNGNILWKHNYILSFPDNANSFTETSDGGFMIVGTRTTSSTPASGTESIHLIKTDSAGNYQWSKIYGGTSADIAFCIKPTLDNNYIIAGMTASFGAGGYDGYMLKIDSAGNIIWTKTIGNAYWDKFTSVVVASNGDYIFVGEMGHYGKRLLIHRTDSNGNTLINKIIGDSSFVYVQDIKETNDGGYILSGYTDNHGFFDFSGFLLKMDSSLNVSWGRKIKSDTLSAYFYSAEQTSDGGYIAGGKGYYGTSTYPAFFIAKTDVMGFSGCNDSDFSVFDSSLVATESFPTTTSGVTSLTNYIALSTSLITNPFITLCSTVGVNEENKTSVSCYPNPTKDFIYFEGLETKSVIQVFDLFGKCINSIVVSGSHSSIDLSSKSSGIYFYRITDKNNVVQQGKICLTK